MKIMPTRIPFPFASQASLRCSVKKKRTILEALAIYEGETEVHLERGGACLCKILSLRPRFDSNVQFKNICFY